jgi:hypothetical protein
VLVSAEVILVGSDRSGVIQVGAGVILNGFCGPTQTNPDKCSNLEPTEEEDDEEADYP